VIALVAINDNPIWPAVSCKGLAYEPLAAARSRVSLNHNSTLSPLLSTAR